MIFFKAKALGDYLIHMENSRYLDRPLVSGIVGHYKPETTVVVSGGFDPLHIGHLQYIEAAAKLGDVLIAIVNGDGFLKRKKGYAFMDENQRAAIVHALGVVDHVLIYDDGSQYVAGALQEIKPDIFANGGDRTNPEDMVKCELDVCIENDIEIIGGVGGDHKADSSSKIVERVKSDG